MNAPWLQYLLWKWNWLQKKTEKEFNQLTTTASQPSKAICFVENSINNSKKQKTKKINKNTFSDFKSEETSGEKTWKKINKSRVHEPTLLCPQLPCDWPRWHHWTRHQTATSLIPAPHSGLARCVYPHACWRWLRWLPSPTWSTETKKKKKKHRYTCC